MTRKSRRKLPAPLGYTTDSGTTARDLFLIRTARDLSSNTSYYTQLEARRLDAELDGHLDLVAQTRTIACTQLAALGIEVTLLPRDGVVLHRIGDEGLPPRLRNELDTWSPREGQPASENTRSSVVPWMLLARLDREHRATRTTAATLGYYVDGRIRSRSVLKERARTRYENPRGSRAARTWSHISELGQARYRRYAHYDRQVSKEASAPLHLPASLRGVPLDGVRQVLERGTADANLHWEDGGDTAVLTVTLCPQSGGAATRYTITMPADELCALPQRAEQGPTRSSTDGPTDSEWEKAEQGELVAADED